jgi:hypothetical protein
MEISEPIFENNLAETHEEEEPTPLRQASNDSIDTDELTDMNDTSFH